MNRSALGASAALVVAVGAACGTTSTPAPAPVVVCDSTATAASVQTFALADVGVYLDASDPLLAPVRADLATYLGAMWAGGTAGAVSVASSAPDGSKRLSLWLSTSPAAADRARHRDPGGLRTEAPRRGRSHDAPRLRRRTPPTSLPARTRCSRSSARASSTPSRSSSLRWARPAPPHGARRVAHARRAVAAASSRTRCTPSSTSHVFMQPGDANLADAKRFVDWLVKTGQNYVQWPLLVDGRLGHVAAVRAGHPRLRALARRPRRRRAAGVGRRGAAEQLRARERRRPSGRPQMAAGLDKLMHAAVGRRRARARRVREHGPAVGHRLAELRDRAPRRARARASRSTSRTTSATTRSSR